MHTNPGRVIRCYTCVPDIDECALGEDNCHDTLASCTDIVGGSGSFECACITGYTGDGVTCTSMGMWTIIMLAQSLLNSSCMHHDECTMNGDCAENAECIDNGGSYLCVFQ